MSDKKTLYVVSGAVVVLVALIYFFAPEGKTEGVKWAWREITAPRVNKCMEYWEMRLKDPDSVIYVKHYLLTEGKRPRIFIETRAKNGFGAYVNEYMTCGLDKDGQIDLGETFKYQNDPYYGIGVPEDEDVPAPLEAAPMEAAPLEP